MKIKYTIPYDLARYPVEVDLDSDFLKFKVGTVGYSDSNKFLVSLWHQMNINICPTHSPERIPWAYFPGLYIEKKLHASVLGFVDTSIGEIYIALSYTVKGNIDYVHFHKTKNGFSADDRHLLEILVKKAYDDRNITELFVCKAHLVSNIKNINISSYSAEHFQLYSSKDDNFILEFKLDAVDKFEAEQIAMERLYDITAFLSVETNVYITFEKYCIANDYSYKIENVNKYFVNDFIDDYPLKEGIVLCLSEYAVSFIEEHILSLQRYEKRLELDRYFLSSCKHCQIAMENENRLGTQTVAVTQLFNFNLSNKNIKRKGEYTTSAMMSYLSAIECATAKEGTYEICKECGAKKYKIANRVKQITTKYLGEELGNVFYKLYAYRSKFLHEGSIATELNRALILPVLSERSATLLVDPNGFSVKANGEVRIYDIKNIHEWTSYVLRCFYQEKILGRSNFKNVFSDSMEYMGLPVKICAPTPDASKVLIKILKPLNI